MSSGRVHIPDRWEIVPPTPSGEPVDQREKNRGDPSLDAIGPVRTTRVGVTHRSKLICLAACSLSLLASLASVRLLRANFSTSYSPPPPIVLVVLAFTWVMLETMPLYAALRGDNGSFVRWIRRMMLTGPLLMAVGRFGLSLTALQAGAVVFLPTAVLLPAIRHLFTDEVAAPTRKFFLYLLAFGLTIQTGCAPSDGLAAVRAIALAILLLGFVASYRPVRLLKMCDMVAPARLATALWCIACLTVAANAAVKLVTGGTGPGITIAGVGFAPYWWAALLLLSAVGIELLEGTWKRLGIGLGVASIEYLFLLHEGGTLLMILIGVVLVTAILGDMRQVTGALIGGVLAYFALVSARVADLARLVSNRIADRLDVWNGKWNPQMACYLEMITASGLIGFCGAARPAFLIPAASKDFVIGAAVAQAGLLGLVAMSIALACYLLEVARSVVAQTSSFRRASASSILAAFCSSVVVAYFPVTGWLMAVGLPLPAISRGSAVTVAACAALVSLEWLTNEEAEWYSDCE